MGCMCACGGAVSEVSAHGVSAMEAVTSASARPGRRTSRVAFAGEAPVEGDPLLGFAPYVHKQPRRNAITPDRQRAFIAALAASGIVTQAARAIGASLEALYRLRNQPGAEGFAAAWEAAADEAEVPPCPAPDAEAGPVGGHHFRPLDDLLHKGDKALGFPHLSGQRRMRQQLGLTNMRHDPLTIEEEDVLRWQADLDAGRIGPRSRGEV
ncbi:hypothetical protein [Novosphingobium umbonatum]|uniref:hypothetical protein n=1 Tax=Novosphingobium umbonatum TaxID=1908524 RepID=UPI001FE561BA|nr:hypothetical protein [Novosphingobium umbonatum]